MAAGKYGDGIDRRVLERAYKFFRTEILPDARDERRKVTRRFLEHSFGSEEIAEANSRVTALEVVNRCHPDVVVLEIQMPLEEGLETITQLAAVSPRPRIVVCSFHRDAATIEAARERGADYYLPKPASSADLRAALGPIPEARAARHRPPNERPVSPPSPAASHRAGTAPDRSPAPSTDA